MLSCYSQLGNNINLNIHSPCDPELTSPGSVESHRMRPPEEPEPVTNAHMPVSQMPCASGTIRGVFSAAPAATHSSTVRLPTPPTQGDCSFHSSDHVSWPKLSANLWVSLSTC